ncbi:MAG: type II toxin-antitoxin system RelE/ParE family toxin [Chromatiales bacterium]
MAFRLKFRTRALREIGEAYAWYETQSPGLGNEFMAATELQLRRLEQAPFIYPEILRGVRRAMLPRFPYALFYTVRGELLSVLAVIHSARDPMRWPPAGAKPR